MIKIGLTGDVMIGRLVDQKLNHVPSSYLWGDLLPLLRSTDFNLINLEAAITRSEKEVPKVFNFKADPSKAAVLIEGAIQAVNIANNHILDYDIEGLKETIQVLDRHHILHTGAGNTLEEASNPILTEVKGIKIGILGFTDNEPGWKAGINHPGTNYIPINETGFKTIRKAMQKIRKDVDLLIVTIHWGPNMRAIPPKHFVSFARDVIDAGASVFHGHSAHIFQGVEAYNHGVILYDTGDFVDDYAVDPCLRNDHSFFFILETDKNKLINLRMIPTVIDNFQVNLAVHKEREEIIERMIELSSDFGTTFLKMGNELVLPLK